MTNFLESIERIKKIDWDAFRSRPTSAEVIENFVEFKKCVWKTRTILNIKHDPATNSHPGFSTLFTSLAEVIHPDMESPPEVLGLVSEITSRLDVRGGQFALMGCRAYVMWAYMLDKHGAPDGISGNPYERLVEFFEQGGMYQTEHNIHVGSW